MTALTLEVQKPQLVCVHCGKPWGSHASRGEWCLLDQEHGQIFSRTHKFEARKPGLCWVVGDTYTVEGGRHITGIVSQVRDTYVLAWEVEVIAGEVRSFIKTSRFMNDIIRLVAA